MQGGHAGRRAGRPCASSGTGACGCGLRTWLRLAGRGWGAAERRWPWRMHGGRLQAARPQVAAPARARAQTAVWAPADGSNSTCLPPAARGVPMGLRAPRTPWLRKAQIARGPACMHRARRIRCAARRRRLALHACCAVLRGATCRAARCALLRSAETADELCWIWPCSSSRSPPSCRPVCACVLSPPPGGTKGALGIRMGGLPAPSKASPKQAMQPRWASPKDLAPARPPHLPASPSPLPSPTPRERLSPTHLMAIRPASPWAV